ncbi:aminomethyl-transferring glycine dehydrogenase [Cocleimonas sp. KMM 6892]|uniref:aminomethyl-transferring glycine dehydrogenase n=1 Tax=unclassified Cocleimonas TaxID=2639732 RepID=UPI002DB5FC41|nr:MULTISPECIES: aminomethyl-transferring glycine dehydrogenase [unclassified Cocleimonas]MEB8432249.1 aminomethyl-transferring glycine dehydrogenase [Cocleimonas sp. KMM 6892]MEC4714665.1 aminomethyl-transferring glycine dehydrogenase [Cocleimonas sp. KMM 6895]MEC4744521.1 aminomethyl-transferring glycine dehydrogenase [Cocleimonas sp. KMM 6896]
MKNLPLNILDQHDDFISRHIGPQTEDLNEMLEVIGVSSLDELADKTVPETIRIREPLKLDDSCSEREALETLSDIADKNVVNKSFIGLGYYDTIVPSVIQRNVLENPGWYTAYTPYQAEISQGRLEGLLNFQQMIMDLTGMDMANASLLDEATAAAEAMALCKRSNRLKTDKFFVDEAVFPQTLEVMKTRAQYFGFELIIGNPQEDLKNHEVFGVLLQYPGTSGEVSNIEPIITQAHEQKALVCVAADLMSLVLLKAPGEMGADIVFGTSQRFGVPMGFGGPHAAFFAVQDKLKRSVPGRVIGVSVDSRGNQGLRMAMQTREQHIRRDKATSNICTAQALLANMAGFYAVYHGAEGLKRIASRINRLTSIFAAAVRQSDLSKAEYIVNTSWFDTLTVFVGDHQQAFYKAALDKGINLRLVESDKIGISFDETKTAKDLETLFEIFFGKDHQLTVADLDDLIVNDKAESGIPADYQRETSFLTHEVFKQHHTETEMMRYLKRLENKDLSLVHAMIPLGSCTMKLNAASELMPLSWSKFSNIHPFAPKEQTVGYHEMIDQLEAWLAEVTGYAAVSMQPNSGAQGEYAGLVAINRYNKSIGQGHRNICLTPTSAHGTNPASAAMARMKIVLVNCDDNGNVDLEDLRTKAEANKDDLACIMVTYPSTHGVFEEGIVEMCKIVHDCGGQVYLDGANLNAQKGLSKPGVFGSDVSHLNLHKTFAIPHGGGGPGVGPIGVRSHLAPFLPGHINNEEDKTHAVSGAPFGSASILTISWMYMKMLGAEGNAAVSKMAIVNANYITERLAPHYPVLYRGKNGRVAHECIIDIRPIKNESGISEEDIAKRLMDYGFHAPTMSFPVAGTLMIEPTESESKYELDRFCDAMIAIREEIKNVETGVWSLENNPLVNAPHTIFDISENWDRPYSQETAVLPKGVIATSKYWPTVNRIDNVYGDRNLVCSCPSIESYR